MKTTDELDQIETMWGWDVRKWPTTLDSVSVVIEIIDSDMINFACKQNTGHHTWNYLWFLIAKGNLSSAGGSEHAEGSDTSPLSPSDEGLPLFYQVMT